jgi:hypothetical protein
MKKARDIAGLHEKGLKLACQFTTALYSHSMVAGGLVLTS